MYILMAGRQAHAALASATQLYKFVANSYVAPARGSRFAARSYVRAFGPIVHHLVYLYRLRYCDTELCISKGLDQCSSSVC